MEIGTWNGAHAVQMIEAAKGNFQAQEIEYYGFDLFESLDEQTLLREFGKRPPPLEAVRRRLQESNARVFLYQGDTKQVLPRVIGELPVMDFIFIDGGHSIETIENDWMWTRRVMGENTVVVFDDYWNRDEAGCKRIVAGIDSVEFNVQIVPIQDRFRKEWGVLTVNLVEVRRKPV